MDCFTFGSCGAQRALVLTHEIFKSTIENHLRSNKFAKTDVIMIVLLGTWMCSRHNKEVVGRCIGRHHGMCQIYFDVGSKILRPEVLENQEGEAGMQHWRIKL